MLNVGNQIHNFISSSVSGTVINFGFGSDFLTSYGSGSGPLVKKLRFLRFRFRFHNTVFVARRPASLDVHSKVKFSLNHVSVSLEVSGFRFNLRRAGSQESILSDLTLEKEDSSSSSSNSNSKSNSNSNSSSSNSLEQTLYRSLQMAHQSSSLRCFFISYKNHAVFWIRDLVRHLGPSFN
jgi:hypothetical protein